MSSVRKIYFDYAASTPVDAWVLRAMNPYFRKKFGNPGSLHSFGQEAITAVDESRETIGKAIGAEFREIIFTGSATEANNLALRGVLQHCKWKMTDGKLTGRPRPKIVVSAIEHESVLETARDIEKDGVEIVYLPVNRAGIVDLKKIESALDERTILVSVMLANNEIGAIQPVAEISKIVRDFRERSAVGDKKPRMFPLLHTDAVQSFQFLDCDVNTLGVDLMTLSSHKIYGPKGVGALFVKRGTRNTELAPRFQASSFEFHGIIAGGGQEFGFRSGTENVPLIAGFAKAVDLAVAARAKEAKRIAALREIFWRGIKKIYPQAERNGDVLLGLPNVLNVYFPGRLAEELLTRFDLAGLAVSSGSACGSRSAKFSYVIEALGFSRERARNSMRFSFGRQTTREEITKALRIVRKSLCV